MADLSFFDNRLLYGGDYNPDQWLDRPEILEEDIRLMKKARVSVVSLGIFAWSTLEPEEGVFRFEWMDRILDSLHEAGVSVFLATPSGARPVWMAEKYPEVLRVNSAGQRNLFGARHNHCYSSPVYREKVRIMNGHLARSFGTHPAVKLWHISNEYSGECHCELCQENFRRWLQARYGSLEALNKAWWNAFWSHTLTGWEQIHSPMPHGETTVHGLNLDWKRFSTYMTVEFMVHETKALKDAGSDLPVTTNMMLAREEPSEDPGLDYWQFRNKQDIASWDSYPSWHLPGYKASAPDPLPDEPVDDYRRASEVALQHDLMRSLHHRPFLLMESTPSKVNWMPLSKNKRPGMNVLSSLHAVAHGANAVQYFQWRQSQGSFEKFHGAVVDQSGSEDTAVFREAAELGEILLKLKPLAETDYPAETAILFNWENRWALEDSKGPLNTSRKAYLETVRKHYYSLWNAGIPVDVISGAEDLSRYKLAVAPMLYMVAPETAESFRRFVREGGTLVTTYLTGYADKSDLCFEGGAPGPLRDVLGIRVEDLDVLHPYEQAVLEMGKEYPLRDYYEIVHPETARVTAGMGGEFLDNLPGVTVNDYGKGKAFHLAGRMDTEGTEAFYQDILSAQKMKSNHRFVRTRGEKVNIQIRRKGERQYLFIMNFDSAGSTVELREEFTDVLSGRTGKSWKMDPYGIFILEK